MALSLPLAISQAHVDQVGTTLEGQYLGHLDAVLLGGFQANLQFVGCLQPVRKRRRRG